MEQVRRNSEFRLPAVPQARKATEGAVPRARYSLFILWLVCILCYVDRTIITAVAESLKREMGITDAQLGFLYGTSFSILFALFGFPLGRLSDILPRTKLMAAGLFFWSLMTMLGGASWNFAALTASRIGLGLGEATANPASHSLISQYFSRAHRGRALSVYLTGLSIGSGLGLLIGGWMVQNWSEACASFPVAGACGLSGWRAAMLFVGAPGLLLALLVARLREPPRPRTETAGVGSVVLREFSASVPPLTFLAIAREGGGRALAKNLATGAIIALLMTMVSILTGDIAQWVGFGLGVYALLSWGTMLRIRDRPLFALTFGSPTFLFSLAGFTALACIVGSTSFWAIPYAIRVMGIAPADAGLYMGLSTTLTATIGGLSSGFAVDWWRQRDSRAPLWIGALTVILLGPVLAAMCNTTSQTVFLAGFLALGMLSGAFASGAAVLAQELVLVRMRGTAAACFSLTVLLVSLALGPYMVGKISGITGSLQDAMMMAYGFAPIALVCFFLAARHVAGETDDMRRARAAAHGEALEQD